MQPGEYTQFDAVGLAELVARGEVTAAQIHECALAVHEQLHPLINGVVEVYPTPDADIAVDGPLGGVPFMVKDLFHGHAGRRCENGSLLSDGWTVPGQTQIYARAVAAGMTDIGRTTTSEFGILGTTQTLAQGPTSSPWSPRHIAGGSSGGAGAVVGAGVVPVALASDGGGSIRIPAAACGVVGLKPSRGRVPWGLHLKEPLLGWAVQFAITRSVRDAAALLDVLGGPVAGDAEGVPRPSVPYSTVVRAPVRPLTIAYCTEPWSGHDPDPAVTEATEATAGLLASLGHTVEPARPAFSSTNALTIDGLAAALGREVTADTVEGSTLAMVEYGRRVSALDLLRAIDVETEITYAMAGFFAQYDVLLTPTLGARLPTLDHHDPTAYVEPAQMFSSWSRWESFLPVFNTTGQPAISLPLHVDPDGLPIGMHFVGRTGDEATLLQLATQLEDAAPWSARRPPAWVG